MCCLQNNEWCLIIRYDTTIFTNGSQPVIWAVGPINNKVNLNLSNLYFKCLFQFYTGGSFLSPEKTHWRSLLWFWEDTTVELPYCWQASSKKQSKTEKQETTYPCPCSCKWSTLVHPSYPVPWTRRWSILCSGSF